MITRYIIQLKRKYYWEDVLTYCDKKQCFVAYQKLLQGGLPVRIVEVFRI